MALTAAMMLVEIAAGAFTGSMALLADGLHMATHAGALGVAAIAYGYARRNAENPQFTFGTGKVGDLAGFASALVLALIALGIGSDHGHDHYHGHAHHGHAHDDNNLRSAYVHVLADALTSILAIGALLAGRFLGWGWMDAAMGIVGAIVIARWSWTLLRDTGAVLLDATAEPGLEAEIREAIEDGDATITDLHVWRVGPGQYATIIALVAGNPFTPNAYAARVRVHEEIAHVAVEVHSCAGNHRHLKAA